MVVQPVPSRSGSDRRLRRGRTGRHRGRPDRRDLASPISAAAQAEAIAVIVGEQQLLDCHRQRLCDRFERLLAGAKVGIGPATDSTHPSFCHGPPASIHSRLETIRGAEQARVVDVAARGCRSLIGSPCDWFGRDAVTADSAERRSRIHRARVRAVVGKQNVECGNRHQAAKKRLELVTVVQPVP